jgi:hypothetical protein
MHELNNYKKQVGGRLHWYAHVFVMLKLTQHQHTQSSTYRQRGLEGARSCVHCGCGSAAFASTKTHRPLLHASRRDDSIERGLAVSAGHHSIFITWEDPRTTITLQLTGDKYEISLMLIYRSKQLQALADDASERGKLAGL